MCWLLKAVKNDPDLKLQIVVTGMHLSPRFGSTYREIEQDGFRIDRRVDILRFDDSESGIAKTIGTGSQLFADAFKDLRPDLVVIFADRFEMLAASIAAYVAKVPIAHLHGGETSQGVIDEAFRHAITKMSHIHFPATEVYRNRIIQLGENPKHVFNFGSMGLEGLHHLRLLTRSQLEERLRFNLDGRVALCTYHPVTLEKSNPGEQIEGMLKALKRSELKVIFSKSNADTHGSLINGRLRKFCRSNPGKYMLIENLGQLLYLSCLKHCDVMVGNSSSGIIEAASFKMPVVNIGDRQKGRIRNKNIIDVGYAERDITKGIKRALSSEFKKSLNGLKNPYDRFADGKVSLRIKDKLKIISLNEQMIKKAFFDIKL